MPIWQIILNGENISANIADILAEKDVWHGFGMI